MVTPSETKRLKLEVSNFGPIAEGTVELRPMTVFVGPSNTGKSYLATLIYALHQIFAGYSGPGLPRFRSAMGSDLVVHQLIWPQQIALSDEDIAVLSTWGDKGPTKTAAPTFAELPEPIARLARLVLGSVGITTNISDSVDAELARCFGVAKTENLVRYPSDDTTSFSLHNYAEKATGNHGSFSYESTVPGERVTIATSIHDTGPVQVGLTHRVPWYWSSWEERNESNEDTKARAILGNVVSSIVSGIGGPVSLPAFYLPADRAGVMHAHQVAVRGLISTASRAVLRRDSPMPILSGVLGDFLQQLVTLAPEPMFRIRHGGSDLAERLERELMRGTVGVEASQIDYPAFVYQPNGWQRELPLANASSMVSELAPVVLYLRYIVQPGETLIIEEPESHLHPQAQVEFTRVLAAAVKAGIRVVITTHSEWVLEELANLVRMSELSPERREGLAAAEFALTPDEIGAWFFDPNGENGGSVVREIPLDVDSGTFPSGFGLVTADLYNRWVEITSRVENG